MGKTNCGFFVLAASAPTALVLSASTVYVEYLVLEEVRLLEYMTDGVFIDEHLPSVLP
jgi:hypothetical protein